MKKGNNQITGFKNLVASALAFSLMSVCVKKIGERIPISELVFGRAILSLIFTRFLIAKAKINPWGKNKRLLILRGLVGSGALFCIFKALIELPIAIATIIQYTYPSFAAVIASILLHEKTKKSLIISLIVGWLGIVLVVQQPFSMIHHITFDYKSLIYAITGAFLTALAYICVRKLSIEEDKLVIIHYFPLISIPLTIPFMASEFVMPIGIEWLWLLGIGIFTQLGQLFITTGLKLLPVGLASSINYSQVIFATTWGILIFKEQFNFSIAIGGICVLISTIISFNPANQSKNFI